MKDEKRHFLFVPAPILDEDDNGPNDVDFTFKGMGLWVNRPERMTDEQILKKLPFKVNGKYWVCIPNKSLDGLTPLAAIRAGRSNEVRRLAEAEFPDAR